MLHGSTQKDHKLALNSYEGSLLERIYSLLRAGVFSTTSVLRKIESCHTEATFLALVSLPLFTVRSCVVGRRLIASSVSSSHVREFIIYLTVLESMST
jgi:hypothetical protein